MNVSHIADHMVTNNINAISTLGGDKKQEIFFRILKIFFLVGGPGYTYSTVGGDMPRVLCVRDGYFIAAQFCHVYMDYHTTVLHLNKSLQLQDYFFF